MRMEKPFDPFRGRALRQVLLGKFIHRADKRLDAGDGLESITVGLAFVEARVGIQRGHQHERKHAAETSASSGKSAKSDISSNM